MPNSILVITITEDWSRKEIFILLTLTPRLLMTQYRKISKNISGKLTAKEAFLFYCLALKSDYITNYQNCFIIFITNDSDFLTWEFFGI